jgi:hypothetical protein
MLADTQTQRAMILRHLQSGSLNTLDFRKLDFLSAGQRIAELREAGFYIVSFFEKAPDSAGDARDVARYCYLADRNQLTKKGEAILKEVSRAEF